MSNSDPVDTTDCADICGTAPASPASSVCITLRRLTRLTPHVSISKTSYQEPRTHAYQDNDIGGLVTSSVECSTGIISACIPTFGPLINRVTNGHTNSNSTAVWPSHRSKPEDQHIRLSHTARNSSKGWSNIEAWIDRDGGEEAMHLYERH